MSEADFEWYDTGLIKRNIIAMSVAVLGVWIMIAVLIITGLLAAMAGAIVGTVISLLGAGIGTYLGLTDTLKRYPTSVGLSAKGIRLQYRDGHHEDILWNNVDGIVYIGSSSPSKIIHKDGSFTPVGIPKRITVAMKTKFQEIKRAVEKVE